MYDYSRLEGRIIEKYGTRQAFAEAVGFNPTTFSRKLNGAFEFRPSEMSRMIETLEIPLRDVGYYFFLKKTKKI